MIRILWEDEDIIVVYKPTGMESQSARGFDVDMVSEISRHIHNQSTSREVPFVGVVHRLDKPVCGIMVYGKSKNATIALNEQIKKHTIKKKYHAVLCGKLSDNVENYVDYLLKSKNGNESKIVDKWINGAKHAELICKPLKVIKDDVFHTLTLVEVELLTGRHHQIRVQMAGRNQPIWGDRKYNHTYTMWKKGENLALASVYLGFFHPRSQKWMEFEEVPKNGVFSNFY